MKVAREKYYTFLFAVAYTFSVLYFPLEIAGASIINRVVPILIFASIILARLYIGRFVVGRYTLLLFMALLIPGISSFASVNSALFYLNFAMLVLSCYIAFNCLLDQYGSRFLYGSLKYVVVFSVFIAFLGIVEYYFYSELGKLWFFRGSPYYESKGQVSSLYSNPNIFGIMSAIVIQVGLMLKKLGVMTRVSTYFAVAVLAGGVWFSGSRMGLAILFFILMYRIFFQFRPRPFAVVATVYAMLVLLSIGYNYLPIADVLNFRDVVWRAALEIFSGSMLFGIGMGNLENVITQYNESIQWRQGPNNYVWGFLVECGLIFFTVFTYFVLRAFWKRQRPNRFDSEAACLVSVMLLSQFSEHFFLYVSSFVLLFFLVISALYSKNPDIELTGIR